LGHTAAMGDALVTFAHLGKRYGSFTAVADMSFSIATGELFALLGPNGAGKTTLLRMLIGQLKATSGTATIAGLDCFSQRAEVMALTGYVPDDPFFHDYLTGRELIRFVAGMHALTMAEVAPRIAMLSERLQLDEALDEYAINYSKGMKKKLALILAMLHEPRLLVLDEPTNGLDPHSTRVLHEMMGERCAQGCTVLFSTHLLDQVERVASRIAIMARGQLATLGTLGELTSQVPPGASLEDVFFLATAGSKPTQGTTVP